MAGNDSLEEKVRTLESRLRLLEDVEAIRQLKARYGELVDARYGREGVKEPEQLQKLAGEIADLFSADAVWEGGKALGTCRGRQEIYERFLKPTLRFSWHYFVKPRIQVDGDGARGTWDILAPCSGRDGKPLWMAGVEDDEYVREDGRWLHSRMKLRVVFMAPHSTGWARSIS